MWQICTNYLYIDRDRSQAGIM